MNLIKSLCAAVAMVAVVVAEPALPGQFQYLPPDKGYKYDTPKVPFRPPTTPYRPPTTPYRPPTTPYRPPVTIRPPVTTPSYFPPPTQPPTLPPTRPPYVPPVTYPVGPPVTSPPYNPPTRPPYNPPTRQPYNPPSTDDHHHDHVHVPGMPFDFEYAVKDDAHGADYLHRANSNGDVVQGEYRNLLPDGRLQIVRYTADWATGFHAEVTYEGEPRYPAPRTYVPPQQQQQPPLDTAY